MNKVYILIVTLYFFYERVCVWGGDLKRQNVYDDNVNQSLFTEHSLITDITERQPRAYNIILFILPESETDALTM